MKWYCLGIHCYRDWLSWGSSKQLLGEWPEDPVIALGGAWGHFSFSYHDKRMGSTVSNSKAGHSLESSVPAAGLGTHLAEPRCLPGSLHRGQKPLHTRRHIHARGRGVLHRGGRAFMRPSLHRRHYKGKENQWVETSQDGRPAWLLTAGIGSAARTPWIPALTLPLRALWPAACFCTSPCSDFFIWLQRWW